MVPFLNRANQSIEELREGYVKIKMPFRGNENHAGFMYAGSLFTLGESSILPLIMFERSAKESMCLLKKFNAPDLG